ncbi:MAG: hypothetical protein VX176_00380 [Candidatus Neomarinimicrobiota bacterium]|nr:hypothetical protein [Candidatus Neomarinimicrobiota bacterium]
MKKRFVSILFIGCIFSQSVIDTLSVTIYPEYYYQGIMVEYKFDTDSSNQHQFILPTEIDSVLYLVSDNDELFEEVLKIENQLISSIEREGEHKIYLFLNRYSQVPGPRNFSYKLESLSDVETLMIAFQLPFASEEFVASINDINLEEIKDQNGLNFLQGLIDSYQSNEPINLSLSYFNPHGLTSIQYSANISADNSVSSSSMITSREKFINYPFLTWEPMLIFLILTLTLVFLYEISNRRKSN